MTITSINHNPNNESKYARRRSIWKGQHNQLEKTIAQLNGTSGVKVDEYLDRHPTTQFGHAWNVRFSIVRDFPTSRRQILGKWKVEPPSAKLLQAIPGTLQGDLRLLWDDFVTVTARRIGHSDGAGSSTDDKYSGQSLMVFAPGPNSFDLIVSKYGYGQDLKRNHHFFHWQSRAKGFSGVVSVDDYESEEGLTFYVVS